MKEWDLDSYTRKWRGTYGFYKKDSGELCQGSFFEFFPITNRICGVVIAHTPNKTEKFALEEPVDKMKWVSIEYKPIESGWYVHRSGAVLLTRRHVRGFQIGLTTNNHTLYPVDGKGNTSEGMYRFYLCDFTQRPKYTTYKPDLGFGILNDRLWWKGDQLFFLNRTIGLFKGNKLEVENQAYVPYIKPFLGDECLICS